MKPEEQTAQTATAPGPYMNAAQGAKYLTISNRHYARLKARGMIKFVRLSPGCIRYRKSDLDALMAK